MEKWKYVFEEAKFDDELMNQMVSDIHSYQDLKIMKDKALSREFECCFRMKDDLQHSGLYEYHNRYIPRNFDFRTFSKFIHDDKCWCGKCDEIKEKWTMEELDMDYPQEFFDDCYTCQDYNKDIKQIYDKRFSTRDKELYSFEIFEKFMKKYENSDCLCGFCESGQQKELIDDYMEDLGEVVIKKAKGMSNEEQKEYFDTLKTDGIPFHVLKEYINHI